MNPPGDAGKRPLPPGLRSRFTELFVDEVTDAKDLSTLVARYFEALPEPNPPIAPMVDFYLEAREAASAWLTDGAGMKPSFSLRTLCRALRSARAFHDSGLKTSCAIVEGALMSFATGLDSRSISWIHGRIMSKLGGAVGVSEKDMSKVSKRPGGRAGKKTMAKASDGQWKEQYIQVETFWLPVGRQQPVDTAQDAGDSGSSVKSLERPKFVIVPSVKANLRALARAVACGSHPVLLQVRFPCRVAAAVRII